MTNKDKFYNNLLRLNIRSNNHNLDTKEIMEDLLSIYMEYQQAYYGMVCRIDNQLNINDCVNRFSKKNVTVPDFDSLIHRAYKTKNITNNQLGQISIPVANTQTNEVFCVISILIPKNGIELDVNASQQIKLMAESLINPKKITTRLYNNPGTIKKGYIDEDEVTFKPFFRDAISLCAIVDPGSWEYMFLNKSWERILGYSTVELKSYSFVNWLHVDDVNESLKIFQDVYEGKIVKSYINRYRTKWGEYRYIEWDISRNKENGFIYSIGRDITLQHSNHEKLFFQSNILSGVQDSVLVVNLEGNISYVNQAVINLTGYPKNYLLNSTFDLIFKDKKGLSSDSISVNDLMKKDNLFELQILDKDDQKIWVELRTTFLVDAFDDPIGYLCIIKNITHRKEDEEKLIKKNEALSKANKELDNFVYRVSHDLRAPITSALGLIELSLDSTFEEVKEYLKLQHRSLTKLDNFIHDILNYSRNNRMELKPSEVNIKELLQSTLDQYKFINEFERVSVDIEVEENNPLYCDQARLQVIINNIISNAFKFTCKSYKPMIEIKAVVEPADFILIVRDNGIGIKKEYIDKVFDMFYRATDINYGSGLGLYIVQEAVKKLGGEISVESVINEGSTFKIIIPNLWSIFPNWFGEQKSGLIKKVRKN
ncbi:PAS domain-containing sensor histidine kinase [Flammeovirga pacifica]|uniref:histidine kinase n=1 Tax=Flammeovirga pacifica TaxID=915059 RepID=A0A1S1Z0P2_FLAPC|nr:PAS domain-containing sensor histidine kinase [Flammeovirga pacifica]OHX66838.1 hypothetical protein NH26_10955 [Flammeovirga pacifica]